MARTFDDLERNDIDGALELFREIKEKGTDPAAIGDALRALVMYQDNPAELIRRIKAEA